VDHLGRVVGVSDGERGADLAEFGVGACLAVDAPLAERAFTVGDRRQFDCRCQIRGGSSRLPCAAGTGTKAKPPPLTLPVKKPEGAAHT